MYAFAVYDDAAKAFQRPFFCPSRGIALRSFMDVVGDSSSEFAKHPSDYSLFYLGEFNEETAIFKTLPVPERMALALELVEKSST